MEIGGVKHPGFESDVGRVAHGREMARCGSARWVGGRWLTRGPNGGIYIYAVPGVGPGPMGTPDA